MSRVVIIGGMGPQASLELHRLLIARAAAKGAKDNADYPEILHLSVPIPDFISSESSTAGLQHLLDSLTSIAFRPDDKVVIACNTVHLLLPELEAALDVNFTSLIASVIETIEASGVASMGLLASPTTIRSKLYQAVLPANITHVVTPTLEEIASLERAIRHIIANKQPSEVRPIVQKVIDNLSDRGAEKILLGCTELSLLFRESRDIRLIDPLREVCRGLV